jgi:hypothetical protein
MFKAFKRNKKPKTPETPQVPVQQKRTSAAVNTTPSSSTPTNTTSSSSQPVVNSPPSTPTVITTKSPVPTSPTKQSISVLPTSTSKAAEEKLFADLNCKYLFYKYKYISSLTHTIIPAYT